MKKKEEYENVSKKLAEKTLEELEQVAGGFTPILKKEDLAENALSPKKKK